MKIYTFLFLSILSLTTPLTPQASTQAPGILWQKSLGGTDVERANSIIQSGPDEFVVVGYASSVDGDIAEARGNTDCWVVAPGPTTGIELRGDGQKVGVMPNPTTGLLYANGLSNINITVSGITGYILKQVNNTNAVNIADLTPGTYLITITDRDGSVLKQEMIVKQ